MAVFVRPPSAAAPSVSAMAAPALAAANLSAASAPAADSDLTVIPAARAAAAPVATASKVVRGRTTDATMKQQNDLKVYWGRLIFASAILLVILAAGFTAAILDLKDWSTLLLHSFELLLGIFMGLLGGDIANRRGG